LSLPSYPSANRRSPPYSKAHCSLTRGHICSPSYPTPDRLLTRKEANVRLPTRMQGGECPPPYSNAGRRMSASLPDVSLPPYPNASGLPPYSKGGERPPPFSNASGLPPYPNASGLSLPSRMQAVSLPTRMQAVSLPTRMQAVSLPTRMQAVSLPTRMQAVPLPTRMQASYSKGGESIHNLFFCYCLQLSLGL
jgi:hypothetical protein